MLFTTKERRPLPALNSIDQQPGLRNSVGESSMGPSSRRAAAALPMRSMSSDRAGEVARPPLAGMAGQARPSASLDACALDALFCDIGTPFIIKKAV